MHEVLAGKNISHLENISENFQTTKNIYILQNQINLYLKQLKVCETKAYSKFQTNTRPSSTRNWNVYYQCFVTKHNCRFCFTEIHFERDVKIDNCVKVIMNNKMIVIHFYV